MKQLTQQLLNDFKQSIKSTRVQLIAASVFVFSAVPLSLLEPSFYHYVGFWISTVLLVAAVYQDDQQTQKSRMCSNTPGRVSSIKT